MTKSKVLDIVLTAIGGCALITTLMLLVERLMV